MWNKKLFNHLIQKIKEEGTFCGEPVRYKEDIYTKIGERLYLDRETVKNWIKKDSKGPTAENLTKLEKLLGVSLVLVEKEEVVENEPEVMMSGNYSEFVKNNIKEAYKFLREVCYKNVFLREEPYIDMAMGLDALRICIPKEIFEKIEKFIEEKIEPMVYDTENFLADTYDDTMGYFDVDHEFHFVDEDARTRQFVLRMKKIFGVQEELEEFAMREFYPILVN